MANNIFDAILDKELVGVYGTLKKGQDNHHLIQDSKLVDEGWLEGLTLYDLGPFPAAKYSKNQHPVFVEVYAVNKATLGRLDQLEGYNPNQPENSLFLREYFTASGGPSCWVYIYNDDVDDQQAIKTGVWLGQGINL